MYSVLVKIYHRLHYRGWGWRGRGGPVNLHGKFFPVRKLDDAFVHVLCSHTCDWSHSCRGRFGELKECTSKKTSKRCLVKCVPSALSEGQHEFDILKTVLHETVLRLLTAFSTKSTLYLIFEGAPGEHAAQRLSLRRRYSEDAVACIIRQVTGGSVTTQEGVLW